MKTKTIIFLLIIASLVDAQNININILDENRIDGETTFTIITESANKEPVANLEKENFSLTIAGKELTEFNVTPAIALIPVRIMFCVDISGTMKGEPFSSAKEAIRSWLNRLPQNIETGLCTFGNEYKLIWGFSKNRARLLKKLDELQADDIKTELFYSVYKALEEFNKMPGTASKFLIVFSDGKNEGSSAYTVDDCVKLSRQSGVTIHAIAFQNEDPGYLKNMEKFADISGGIYKNPKTIYDIKKSYSEIYNYLLSSYSVSFFDEDLFGLNNGNVHINIVQGKKFGSTISSMEIEIPYTFPWVYFVSALLFIITVVFILVRFFKGQKEREEELKNWVDVEIDGVDKKLDEYQDGVHDLEQTIKEHHNELENQKNSDYQEIVAPTQIVEPDVEEKTAFLKFNDGRVFELNTLPAKVGKQDNCEIILDHETVSRVHALIQLKNNLYIIEDQDSTNGVRVNNIPKKSARLKSGDQLQFGQIRCTFESM